jgi:hypothetical protein
MVPPMKNFGGNEMFAVFDYELSQMILITET